MISKFSTMISQLRKHKGISQKQAAQDLGVSQSLLSHYEKGIRECGNDFVIKAADYYGVSCDFILGRGSQEEEQIILSTSNGVIVSSSDVDITTAVRSFTALLNQLRACNQGKVIDFQRYMVMCIYRAINSAARSGYVPKNWSESGNIDDNSYYDATISAIIDGILNGVEKKDELPADDIPQCVMAVSDKCESYVKSMLLHTLEKL